MTTDTQTLGDWYLDTIGTHELDLRAFYLDGKLIHNANVYSSGLRGRVHSATPREDGLHVAYDNGRENEVIPLDTEVDYEGDIIRRVGYKRTVQYSQVRLRRHARLNAMPPKDRLSYFQDPKTRGTFAVLDTKIVKDVMQIDASIDGDGSMMSTVVTFLNGWETVTFIDSDVRRNFRIHGPHVYATSAAGLSSPALEV